MATIKDILTKEEFDSLSQFTEEDINWINSRIHTRADGTPGIECVVRGRNDDGDFFKLTPEEVVRQYYARKLMDEYGYDKTQLEFELPVVYAGREIIRDKRIDIRAIIYVERESQKGIIIGHQGVALKKVGMESRKALEKFFGKSIFLETYVKVDKDWRSNKRELDSFGYNPE